MEPNNIREIGPDLIFLIKFILLTLKSNHLKNIAIVLLLLFMGLFYSSCKKDTCYDCRAYNYLTDEELDAQHICGDTDRNNYYKSWNKVERNWSVECLPK